MKGGGGENGEELSGNWDLGNRYTFIVVLIHDFGNTSLRLFPGQISYPQHGFRQHFNLPHISLQVTQERYQRIVFGISPLLITYVDPSG